MFSNAQADCDLWDLKANALSPDENLEPGSGYQGSRPLEGSLAWGMLTSPKYPKQHLLVSALMEVTQRS